MASITIRNLDEDLKRRLRIRAAEHGRSMEDEVREILRGSLAPADKSGPEKAETGLELFKEFRNLIEPLGGVELEPYPDEPMQIPQGFAEDR